MSTIRAPGQKLISVPMNEKFIEAIDAALPAIGYSDRSSFIRDAIVEKLRSAGVEIPTALSLAPSRTGKGGRPPKPYSHERPSAELRETPPKWGAKTIAKSKSQKIDPRKKGKYHIPRENLSQGFGRNYKAK